jgi:phosphoribosylformylglycinamidine cyclo-ligase
MKQHVKKTFGPEVLTGLGGFGSLYRPDLSGMSEPVLVAGTDGVGTKLKIAILMDKHDTVGQDLVAMCANDVLCQGARPLFFLDYIATGHVSAEKIADLVKGVADGCELAGCALVGGETAEMPGFYSDGDYDMAGFCVGLADRKNVIDGHDVAEGDILIGLPSSGLHSNGYSLVRKLFFENMGLSVTSRVEGLSLPLGEELLKPTRIYAKQVMGLISAGLKPKAIVHVTGGGFIENVPRVLPEGLEARIKHDTWEAPEIFRVIQKLGNMRDEDIYNTLNMGIGLICVYDSKEVANALDALSGLGEDAKVIGELCAGSGKVRIV